MMLDATRHYDQPLTEERLFVWHASLFSAGAWRDDRTGPMQVVSGPMGTEHVHFAAPKAERLHDEMKEFLAWFESRYRHRSCVKSQPGPSLVRYHPRVR